MQLDIFAEPAGSCGRTCPAPSQATAGETLRWWLGRWLGADSAFRVTDGGRAELQPALEGSSNGELWTRSMSEWNHIPPRSPSDVAVCSLSSILETGPIDRRYYLSSRACIGILRRSESRGKDLPPALKAALESVALSGRVTEELIARMGTR